MVITGTILNITFYNEENGYAVLRLEAEEGSELPPGVSGAFHAVGTLPLPNTGERVALDGEWTEHAKFGTQFKFAAAQIVLPETLEGMQNYLASGLVHGIGPATAKNIINMFGSKAFEVLSGDPGALSAVKGISLAKAEKMVQSFNEQQGGRAAIIALQSMGVGTAQGLRLYRLYGDDCVQVVRDNPYQLIEDVEGIGFKTADKIARDIGFAADSDFRIRAGIHYTLNWAGQEGSTCLAKERLVVGASAHVLEVDPARVEQVLEDMLLSGMLIIKTLDGVDTVFSKYMYRAESSSARTLLELATGENSLPPLDYEAALARFESEGGMRLEGQQREAVLGALAHNLAIITGGPGTGKTTIIKFILRLFNMAGLETVLCAPTGRAAKRMGEATGGEGRTIHRLLEFTPDGRFARNEDNPLECGAIIIDEVSMVDAPLLYALCRAITKQTRVVIVGDADQLPSVGPGNVLRDMLDSGMLCAVRLTEIFRQAEQSGIVVNAHRINRGEAPTYDFDDFSLIETDRAAVIPEAVKLAAGGALGDFLSDVQVLAPMKLRAPGTVALNMALQAAINPPSPRKAEKAVGGTVFRDGDKVMQIKNNYQLTWTRYIGGDRSRAERGVGVFNGDLGTIMHIYEDEGILEVLFDDERMAFYEPQQLMELELAYAVTIHKSQGSEFKTVLLCLGDLPPMMRSRNLLYTAVTRARERVVILGREASLLSMVHGRHQVNRSTGLRFFLQNLAPLYQNEQS